jgi:sugar O-acyltransferase (sialic acid O-acetyltransferase NeuD family)
MTTKIIIVGGGQQAKILAEEILRLKKFNLLGFLDLKSKKIKRIIINKKKLIIFNKLKITKNLYLIIAIGNNFIREKVKKKIELANNNFKWLTFVSPNSLVSKNVKIGEGTIIMRGSIINCNSKIGDHCIVNTGSIVEHDNIFENFSSIAPGAVTNGSVHLGKRSHIGSSSVVMNKIKINNDVVIGIGSVVLKNCISKSIYFGNPAKFKRKRNINENYI